jgi:hypothetical protein
MAQSRRLFDASFSLAALCALTISHFGSAADFAVPSKAYPTIQSAIDAAAVSGDRVLVAAGTYAGRVDFRGKAVEVVGAGAGVTFLEPAPGGEIVRATSGEPVGAALRGFTLRNATAGAVDVISSALEVSDCVVRDCHRANNAVRGGAIGIEGHAARATFALLRSTIQDNTVSSGIGGAAFIWNADAVIEDCMFLSNAVQGPKLWAERFARGGAVATENAAVAVRRTVFDGNAILTSLDIDTCVCCGFASQLEADGGQLSAHSDWWTQQPTLLVEDCVFRNGAVRLNTVYTGSCKLYDWSLIAISRGGDIGVIEADLEVRRTSFSDSISNAGTSAPPLGSLVNTDTYALGGAIGLDYGAIRIEDCTFTRTTTATTQAGPGVANFSTGGAIDLGPVGTCTVLRSSFTDCATTGPAVVKHGGGIAVRGPIGAVTLDGCTFERCRSGRGGSVSLQRGGNSQSTATVQNCAFRANSASRDFGGAIWSTSMPTSLLGSTFEDNAVDTTLGTAFGGAVFLHAADLLIENSVFRRNRTLANSVSASERNARGGAVYVDLGTLTIRASTYESNSAEATGASPDGSPVTRRAEGGAIFAARVPFIMQSSVLSQNRAISSSLAYGGSCCCVYLPSIDLTDCDFMSNEVLGAPDGRGGALSWGALDNTATLTNCTLRENRAVRGSAIACWQRGADLDSCRLERNFASVAATTVISESAAACSVRSTLICGSGTNWATGPMADLGGNTVSATCIDCNANGIEDAIEVADGTAPDCNANGIPDICDILSGVERDSNLNDRPDRCDADISGDGAVGGADLTILLSNWGATGANAADLDRNGVVSASDLTFLLVNWI